MDSRGAFGSVGRDPEELLAIPRALNPFPERSIVTTIGGDQVSRKHVPLSFLALLFLPLFGFPVSFPAPRPSQAQQSEAASSPFRWQSPARLRHGFKSTSGDLVFTANGIEFRPKARHSQRWTFVDVKTFDLTPRRFVLTDYENRKHHMPGERRFRFDLKEPVPPAVAAELAKRVGKPVVNGDPDAKAQSFSSISARHGTPFGGTNGTLRLRDQGIDYVTADGRGSRSWRWADIETLALPDPYHLRVAGYRETAAYELKEPLPREVFERLWDKVYAHDLKGLAIEGQPGQQDPPPARTN